MVVDTEVAIAVTIPVAGALIKATAAGNPDQVEAILEDVTFPKVLAIMLAAVVNPLLLEDADFDQVKYDHPALCYHAGRYENGDRDHLAVHAYVHKQSIPAGRVAAGVSRWKTGSDRWRKQRS